MGLETIASEILEKAKRETEKINKETEKEVSEILKKAKSSEIEIKKKKEEEVKKTIERIRKQEISSANLEVKRAILNARKEILDETLQKAREYISNLPPEKNKVLLEALIKQHNNEGTKIYSNKRDEPIVKKISNHNYAGNIKCIGGIALENDDGTVRLDYTFDTILLEVNESSMKKISDILF
ncbi:MAG: V-type ATP synthase subunit E [Methanosarcinales archaeon]